MVLAPEKCCFLDTLHRPVEQALLPGVNRQAFVSGVLEMHQDFVAVIRLVPVPAPMRSVAPAFPFYGSEIPAAAVRSAALPSWDGCPRNNGLARS